MSPVDILRSALKRLLFLPLNRLLCLCFLFPFREDLKVNGQMDCHLSPVRHGNVKKVTGVGGTTYEISV